MRLRWLAPALIGTLAAPMMVPASAVVRAVAPGAPVAPTMVRSADVVGSLSPSGAELSDSLVGRSWLVASRRVGPADSGVLGGLRTTALTDEVTGAQWVGATSPDFDIVLDGVTLSSDGAWQVLGTSVGLAPVDPSRPSAHRGVTITFRLATVAAQGVPAGIEVDRRDTLDPGSAVLDASFTVVNHLPVAVSVGAWTIDQVTSPSTESAPVLVDAYHGGSDWQADNRDTSVAGATFDDAGQVAQVAPTGAQAGQGFFVVGDRRGGVMNRVGRDAGGRTWVGVEPARDLLDAGPETLSAGSLCPGQGGPVTEGPVTVCPQLPVSGSTDDVPNPLYPAPVRARTLPALGSLDLGTAYVGVYHGGAGQAAAAFSSHLSGQVSPAWAHSVDLNTFHPWGHSPSYDDASLVPQVDEAAALGVDVFMLDDQWQGSSSGDWVFDTSRFPTDADGVPDIVDQVHAKGMALGLWMSPVEFNPSSATYKAHPQWACAPTGDVTAQIPNDAGLGVWNVNDPGFRSYLSSVIDRLVAQYGVTEFKFDYETWLDCPPLDYLDYEDGFVSLVQSFEARHPGVTFEIDETNDQRLWAVRSATIGPSWFDNDHISPSVPKLLHDLWSAAPWIAPSSLGLAVDDNTLGGPYSVDYLMSIAMLSHPTFWTDLTRLTPAQAADTAWWVAWYKQHRVELAGAVYEDSTADPLDGTSWVALQPWDGDHGYLFAFRQAGGPATDDIAVQGLDPTRQYRLTDVRSGAVLGVESGAALAGGLAVSLAPDSSQVISLTPL